MITRRRRVPVAAAFLLGALLAGCGSGSSTGEVTQPSASVTQTDRTTAAPPTTGATESTEVPTTRAPSVEAPATSTPTTPGAPTTTPPTTAEPTTAPSATVAPTTAPPTTAASTTATSSEATTTLTPSTGEQSTDDGSQSTVWWPWLLAAIVVIGVAAATLARRSRQRAALEARTEGALTDATQLAERLAGLDAGSARAVAAQYASDLVALGAELASLIAQSSDEQRKGALDQPRAQVVALHRIVDSVALSAEPPSDAVIDQLREQATRLHTVTAQARAEVFPTPPTA